jgi:hypothetical protein
MPELADLKWAVRGPAAAADLSGLGGMRTVYQDGNAVLEITPAPDALSWVNGLRELGWTRDGSHEDDMWLVDARLECEGAVLLVSGHTRAEPEHGNRALPYFATPIPALPPRGPLPKGWKARYAEWERKTREREW